MYQFSRAIYRELSRDIRPVAGEDVSHAHAEVLHACEQTIERLATDRHYFRRPARTLFADVRPYFPMGCQERVWHIVESYVTLASEWLAKQPVQGYDVNGNPLQCRATTRRGTPCRRLPLATNGYCPSHQHLADTEDLDRLAAAA